MFDKTFITDCEGPLTLNDNAYEICKHFIKDGDKLFKILSSYDDYLADVVKLAGYKSGNTLKLIIPFLLAEGVKNKDLVNFSKNNILSVEGVDFLINYLKSSMNNFIISTSYGQYIEAVSDYLNVPFENTFFTKVDMDGMDITSEEIEKINEFKEMILKHPENYVLLDEIFFEKMSEFNFDNQLDEIEVVGGVGKKLAMIKIISKEYVDMKQLLYIGDSITDVESLKFARMLNGLSISFNGNEYPLKEAEIAIVSENAIATTLIANVYVKNTRDEVFDFINKYNSTNDLEFLFKEYGVEENISNEFFKIFSNNLPLIKLINKDNFDEILQKSIKMRKHIRGKDIGGLG